MRAPIAKLRISAGNPGWYDPLTNIHLTIARPEAYVYEGSNVTNIKRGVAYKLINVIEGSLNEVNKIENEKVREVAPQKPIKDEITENPSKIEEVIEDKPVEETVVEPTEATKETTEEVVEEKPKAKKTTTRKKATKKEDK